MTAALVLLWLVGATTAAPDAQAVADQVQARYETTRDFTAAVRQELTMASAGKTSTATGTVAFKKPGKMRWDYSAPEQKQFVSDGAKMYSYLPQDKQVIVSTVPPDDEAGTPALFLAGKGSLTRDFTPSLTDAPANSPSGSRALKLVPKTKQREYDWLVLVVDPSSLSIRGLVTTDAQGGKSSFSFTNLKENVGLTDKEFAFKIPRGVDVVTASSRP